jgi:hypothetical protein
MFRGTLSLSQENHHFIVQIGKNKCIRYIKLKKSHKYPQYFWIWFSGNSNILKFLLSPVRFIKCLGVRIPLRHPQKKALYIYIYIYLFIWSSL